MRKQAAILSTESISAADDVSSPDGLDAVRERRELEDGYIGSNGYVFQEDWDDIDPPGCEDEPEFSHEEVVAHIRAFVKELESRK